MKVAVETSQLVVRTYLVDVPDQTPDSNLYDAVSGLRDRWYHEPDWDSVDGDASTDAIFKLDEQGDPLPDAAWPREE